MTKRLFLLLSVVLAGCGESHGDVDAGAMDIDSGSTDMDAGGGREQCGAILCAVGTVCCNDSCGICTAPGEGCPAIECAPDAGQPDGGHGAACEWDDECAAGSVCCYGCEDSGTCTEGDFCPDVICPVGCLDDGSACPTGEYCDWPDEACGGVGSCLPLPEICTDDCPGVCGCDYVDYCNACMAASAGADVMWEGPCDVDFCAPMVAASEGACTDIVGYAWNGSDCAAITCACVGRDCDWIYTTQEDCLSDFWECTGTTCGGFIGTSCGTGEFCDYRLGDFCGGADASGVCRPIPSDCSGEPSAPVCGCDGVDYDNACLAHMAGYGVNSEGACGAPVDDCRTTGCPTDYTCTSCRVGEYLCLAPDEFCLF